MIGNTAGLGAIRANREESTVTNKDKREFEMYLTNCTDRQVIGVYEKESAARRKGYAQLAAAEANKRGLNLD